MEKVRKGFTLVELMVAAMLAGIVLVIALPLILIGRNADVRTEKKEAVTLVGEAIFEYVADEMKFAGRLYIGDLTDNRPSGKGWKSITVSSKSPEDGEKYSRLLYAPARELSDGEAADAGNPLYDEAYQEKTSLVIEAEAEGRNRLRLTVKLMDGEQARYEKTAVLSMLNLSLNATSQIEGYVGGPMSTETDPAGAGGEGITNPLVLWYQSTKETVSPFDSKDLGNDTPAGIDPLPGAEVVSLANPQYVKAGGTLDVQFKAQAGSGKTISRYEWSIVGGTNSSDDGPYIDDDLRCNEETGQITINGIRMTPEDHAVRLTLTVYFKEDDSGKQTSRQDTCDVLVYEGAKPGGGPVDEFVIVPEGQEKEYIQPGMRNTPIWIRNGKAKRIYLVAVDAKGMLTEYSPDNWRSYYNFDQKKYQGFSNGTWQGTYVSLDETTGLQNGTRVDPGKSRNYVEAEALNIDTGYTPRNNSTLLVFGGQSGDSTAYFPMGKNMISAERYVNIYDMDCEWWYGINKNIRDEKGVDGKAVKVEAENDYIDLEIKPEIGTINKVDGGRQPRYVVSVDGIPEIDQESVKWELNGGGEFPGEFVQRFQIRKAETSVYPKLRTGENTVEYSFRDTAGEEYSGAMTIQVPQAVSKVKLNTDSITLLKLEGLEKQIQGLTAQNIEIMLYNEEEELPQSLVEEFTVEWFPQTSDIFAINSGSGGSDLDTPTITPKKVGTDTLILHLTERVPSDGRIPKTFKAECGIKVVGLELNLQLLSLVPGEDGATTVGRSPVQDGSTVYLTDELLKDTVGVGAVISLPKELQGKENELAGTNWDRTKEWVITGDTSLFERGTTGTQINDCLGVFAGKGNKQGKITFMAEAQRDSGLEGSVSFVVGAGEVANLKIWDDEGKNPGEFILNKKETVTLHVELMIKGNKPVYNPNVIWEIVQGEELLDMQKSKLVPGKPIDSQDEKNRPVLVLKEGLPATVVLGKEIVIRAVSEESPEKDDTYRIKIK